MKSFFAVPILATVVLAQGAIEVPPFDELPAPLQPYATVLSTVNTSVIALDTSVLAFQGLSQVGALTQASTDLLQVIGDQTTVVEGLPALAGTVNDVIPLGYYVANLGFFVNETVSDLVGKKDLLVSLCVGPVVSSQIALQSSAAVALQSSIFAKLPTDALTVASGLASTITDALNSGLSVFAAESTQPASCSATRTSTSTTTSTTGTATSTSTATVIYVTYSTGSTYVYTTAPTSHAGWEVQSSFAPGKPSSSGWEAQSSFAPGKPSSYSTVTPSSSPVVTKKPATYTGAAIVQNANLVGGAVAGFAALAAAILL